MKTTTLYRIRPDAEGYSGNLPRNEWHDVDWWRKNMTDDDYMLFALDDDDTDFEYCVAPTETETNRLIALIEYTLNGLAMDSPANKQIATEIVEKWLNGEEVENG